MEEINLEFLYDKPLLESELKEVEDEDEDDTEDILEIENKQRLEESLNITSNLEIIKEKEEKRLSDIEKCKAKYKDYNDTDIIDYESCTLNKCPPGFNKTVDGKRCEMSIDNLEIYRYEKKNKCEEQFLDWILIPNYHLHNSYFKLNTGKVDDDFNGCFKPCGYDTKDKIDHIPYNDPNSKFASRDPESIQCVKKNIAEFGLYGNKSIDYCPLSLINLLSVIEENPEDNAYHNSFIYLKKKEKLKTDGEIEPEIINLIGSENSNDKEYTKNITNELVKNGKNYINFLLKTRGLDFFDKIDIKNVELSKCYNSTIKNINKDNNAPLLNAYNVYKNIKKNKISQYIYNYGDDRINDLKADDLRKLHGRALIWACNYTFEGNSTYSKRILDLYRKFKKKEDIAKDNSENKYLSDIKSGKIKNDMFFYFTDFFNPVKVLNRFIGLDSDHDKLNNNNYVLNNKYILGLPLQIFNLILVAITVVCLVLFYIITRKKYVQLTVFLTTGLIKVAELYNENINTKPEVDRSKTWRKYILQILDYDKFLVMINQLKKRLEEYNTCIEKEGREIGDDCVNIYKD
jgi:hypothetical protein